MNLYFLVEGRRTEKKVYPKWLSYLLPELTRVDSWDEVNENNYYLISAQGYPSIIYDSIPDAIADINSNQKYDYFVVCLDADENTVDEIKNEIYNFIYAEKLELKTAEMEIVVQNRCIETWFLSNRKIYTRNPSSQPLLDYTRYYNVSVHDPELMPNYDGERFNHARFHLAYLQAIFEARSIRYSKKYPSEVLEEYYLNELLKRIEERQEHLKSFRDFIEFCKQVKRNI